MNTIFPDTGYAKEKSGGSACLGSFGRRAAFGAPPAAWVGLSLWVRALLCGVLTLPLWAADGATESDTRNFADMSIEQLMNESVTSVSKRETKLTQSPAAIAVITAEDIRRIGATSIAEALRVVPGLDVGRINASEWAISSRGFNSQYATKLLVLVDGRSVYTPSSSGVFWSTLDLMLEDLDRIEVIRGPGAALWGANAVNGVINIMTKSAKDTQGFLSSVAYGTDLQPLASVRFGGQAGTNLYYRIYGQGLNHDSFDLSDGSDANDEWQSGRTGLRVDWYPSAQNHFTLQGDYYKQAVNQPFEEVQLTPPVGNQLRNEENHNSGVNVLGRWTHTFGPDSESSLQFYYDGFEHTDAGSHEQRDTFDVDWQHRFAIGKRQDVVWGLGYRYTPDEIFSDNFVSEWTPRQTHHQFFSVFAQDEIKLVPENLSLTVGTKLEHNDYTGFEVQPSARLLWTPTSKQTLWAAVSRATRTPNRFESGGRINQAAFQPPASPPILVSLLPAAKLESEKLIAYELGYRIEPAHRLAFDVATFYNRYEDAATFSAKPNRFETTPSPPHVLIPVEVQFANSGDTYGVELQAQWHVTDWWRLTAGYTWLHMRLDELTEKNNPQHQFNLRSYIDVTKDIELNGALYYVDQTSHVVGITPLTTPSYVRLDLGLAWRPTKSLELGVWGQNLLENRHSEFFSYHTTFQTEVPRSVFGKITWRF